MRSLRKLKIKNMEKKNQFERFGFEENEKGFDIVFGATKKPIYIFFSAILILIGIGLYAFSLMDFFGFIFLLIIAVPLFFIGNRKVERKVLCSFSQGNFSFDKELFPTENKEPIILPFENIGEINLEISPEKTLNFWMIAAFQHKVVFKLIDGGFMIINGIEEKEFYPGFDFSFKKSAEEFIERLNELVFVSKTKSEVIQKPEILSED